MTGPSAKTRALVRQRANNRCEVCGRFLREGEGQVHHRHPRKAGGTRRLWINKPANLLLACLGSHAWIESNRTRSYELGLLVHQGHRPAGIPVLLFHGWFLLDDNGNYQPAKGAA